MESWRLVWRDGFAPCMKTEGLKALAEALKSDDPRLIQGATTCPPPLMCTQDRQVEACCAVSFVGWKGDALSTVGEVEEAFARLCFDADRKLGESAGCRWFLNWFDGGTREEVRRELLAEVELALSGRAE